MATQAEKVSGLDKAGALRYDVQIDVNSDTAQAMVIRLAGTDKRILELGCGPGHMSRVLKDRGCKVTAIEIDPVAAERARPFCEKVIVGDLEHVDLDRELGSERFDTIIAADVL